MVKPILHCPDAATWTLRLARYMERGPNSCLVWTGALDRDGYGKFKVSVDGRARWTGAHRATWLATRGDIPSGLVVDHLCRNRACVNVEHMELVSMSVNTQRGFPGRGRQTHCGRGHDFATHGRVAVTKGGQERNVCKPCSAERLRAWRAARDS